jgi:hypothetical protein
LRWGKLIKDAHAPRDLGDDPAAERGRLFGRFDQVDLYQTGQLGRCGELPEQCGDGSIAVGRGPQSLGVDRLQGGPRLVDPLG